MGTACRVRGEKALSGEVAVGRALTLDLGLRAQEPHLPACFTCGSHTTSDEQRASSRVAVVKPIPRVRLECARGDTPTAGTQLRQQQQQHALCGQGNVAGGAQGRNDALCEQGSVAGGLQGKDSFVDARVCSLPNKTPNNSSPQP